MARMIAFLPLCLLVAASPVPDAAPAGTPSTRYCMKIEPVTGSRVEAVRCWTREEWAEQGVDVDEQWSREGIRIIG